jgi:hypothetical protein
MLSKPEERGLRGSPIKIASKTRRSQPVSLLIERPAWQHGCITDGNGKILPILANVATAIRGEPILANAIAFDEMMRIPMLVSSIGDGNVYPRPLTDADVIKVQERMQKAD